MIMAKDIPLSGITDPTTSGYKGGRRGSRLDRRDPDVRTIYETAAAWEGLIAQRRRARLRAVVMSSEPLIEAIPLAPAAGRRGHHRLGLPVLRGHRPVEDGLPRSTEPDDHR